MLENINEEVIGFNWKLAREDFFIKAAVILGIKISIEAILGLNTVGLGGMG